MDDKTASAVGMAVVLVVLFLVLEPLCRPQPPDVNERLAETARQAVEMAREADHRAAVAQRFSDWWYFVALAVGCTVPVAIAFLLFRHWGNAPPDQLEVLHEIEELRVQEPKGLNAPATPTDITQHK